MTFHRFRFLIAAGELAPGGSLAAPLAPFGLELPRLVREVNERALAHYSRGVPVTLRLRVVLPRQWIFRLDPPPLAACLRSLGVNPSRRVLYGLLLWLARQRSQQPQQFAPTFFGALASYQPRILLLLWLVLPFWSICDWPGFWRQPVFRWMVVGQLFLLVCC
jgi:hypothetical protein